MSCIMMVGFDFRLSSGLHRMVNIRRCWNGTSCSTQSMTRRHSSVSASKFIHSQSYPPRSLFSLLVCVLSRLVVRSSFFSEIKLWWCQGENKTISLLLTQQCFHTRPAYAPKNWHFVDHQSPNCFIFLPILLFCTISLIPYKKWNGPPL